MCHIIVCVISTYVSYQRMCHINVCVISTYVSYQRMCHINVCVISMIEHRFIYAYAFFIINGFYLGGCVSIDQSINQVYFQINMYKNEQKVHISQVDRKKVEVEVNNL